jgi:osmotically inducible protein OsmC
MVKRTSAAVWNGDLKKGSGTMKLGSETFAGEYSFGSRFEQAPGTNPEELLGAAHAGCFSMALAKGVADEGYEPRQIRTTAEVVLAKTDKGFGITAITLHAEAEIPDMEADRFRTLAETAKKNCPVSRALAGTRISLKARLVR